MKNELITSKERLLALEQCELKIANSLRRTQEATCTMGRELQKILDEELYAERGYESFSDYAREFLPFDSRSANRFMAIAGTIERLKKAGLALPENESQAAEISRLHPERQSEVWQALLEQKEKTDLTLTVQGIRMVVDMIEQEIEQAENGKKTAAAERPGVETDLDLSAPEPNGEKPKKGAPKPPAHLILSEEGEAALERIRRLCGDVAADSILYLRVPIAERDLRKWAEQDDDVIVSLAHYVIEQRWSVAKALGFEQTAIGPATPFGKVLDRVDARGGSYDFDYLDSRVSITRELAPA